MKPAKTGIAFGSVLVLSLVLSVIHPWGNPRAGAQSGVTLLEGSTAPQNVRRILAEKCGDCHSTNTRYPAYSYLAPVSWMIEHDVQTGRSHLELSRWQAYSNAERISALSRIASEAHAGQMPPKTYLMLHPAAHLSDEEQQSLYDWARAERKRIREEEALRGDPSK